MDRVGWDRGKGTDVLGCTKYVDTYVLSSMYDCVDEVSLVSLRRFEA